MLFLTLFLFFLPGIGSGQLIQNLAELRNIEGTWTLIAAEFNERTIPEKEIAGTKLVISADKIVFVENGKKELTGRIVLRPDQSPKWLDVRVGSGVNEGQWSLGIYQLKGDTMMLCQRAPMRARPREFSSKEMTSLLVLKKQK